ncbi:phage tail tip lysozyme [Labrys sp. KB_33_2]|uniref:phage tail tip lysozyme n=1 Tax=Labrys sp. KB_33_2 TaxID=3237479 RepID=UPI003F92954A
MPRFPDYRAEIGLTPGATPQVRTGAEAIGQGLQALGGGLSEAAIGLAHYQKRARQEAAFDDDNKLGLYKQQRQAALAEAAKTMPAEATGFTVGFAKTGAKVDAAFLGSISAANRERVAADLQIFNDGLMNEASQFEYKGRGTYETNAITAAYQTSLAAIRSNPSQREPALVALNAKIDSATSIPVADRARLKRDIAAGSSIEWAKGMAGSDPDRMRELVWGAKTTIPKGAIGPAQADREAAAMSYFIGRGYSREQAAGIVGNLVHESAGLAPSSRNPGDGSDGSDSVGIAQWNGTRAKSLKAFAADRGKDWRDLSVQLAFVDHELNTDYAGVKARLRAANTADEAAGVFVTDYERPAGSQGGAAASHGWDNRRNQARRLAAGDYKPGEVEEKAPDSVVTSLAPDQRDGLVAYARSQRSQGQAVTQGDLEPRIQDATRALTTIGRYDGRLPTQAEFTASYGPQDGARRYSDFQRTVSLGTDITAIRAMTPAEQTAWLAARDPKGEGPAFETERQLHDRGSEAIALDQAFRRKDPNGYVRSLHPQIDRLWTDAGTSPERLRAALAATNAAMDRLGMPVKGRTVLPKAMVSRALASFGDGAKPLSERIAPIRTLVTAPSNPAEQATLFEQLARAGLPRLLAPALAAYGRGENDSASRLLAAALGAPASQPEAGARHGPTTGSAVSAAPASPLALRGGADAASTNPARRPVRTDTAINLGPAMTGELARLQAAGPSGLDPLTATLYDRLFQNNVASNGGDPVHAHTVASQDIRQPGPTLYAQLGNSAVTTDVPPDLGTGQDNGGARITEPVPNTPAKPPFEIPEGPGKPTNVNTDLTRPSSPGATVDNTGKTVVEGAETETGRPGSINAPETPSSKPDPAIPDKPPASQPMGLPSQISRVLRSGLGRGSYDPELAASNGFNTPQDPSETYPHSPVPVTYWLFPDGGTRVTPAVSEFIRQQTDALPQRDDVQRDSQNRRIEFGTFNTALLNARRDLWTDQANGVYRQYYSDGGYDFSFARGPDANSEATVVAVRKSAREPDWLSGWFVHDEGDPPGPWHGAPETEPAPATEPKPGTVPLGTPGLPGTSQPQPGIAPLGAPSGPVAPQTPDTPPAPKPGQEQTSPLTASGQDKPPGSDETPPAEGAPTEQGTPGQDSNIDPAEPNPDTANDNLDKNKQGTNLSPTKPEPVSHNTDWVRKLYEGLALARTKWQAKAREYQLNNPGKSLRQPKVFSIGVTDGPEVSSTNPGSRSEHGDADADTLAANSIRESGREPDPNGRTANEAMQDAHAELFVLQELHRQGRTEGRSLNMVVTGKKVCPMCRKDLPKAAEAAGLNEWTIFEEATGHTLYWKKGDRSFNKISGE